MNFVPITDDELSSGELSAAKELLRLMVNAGSAAVTMTGKDYDDDRGTVVIFSVTVFSSNPDENNTSSIFAVVHREDGNVVVAELDFRVDVEPESEGQTDDSVEPLPPFFWQSDDDDDDEEGLFQYWCYACSYDFEEAAEDDDGLRPPACPRCESNEQVEVDDGRS
jgi:DNA-directed RNA polymerase subunit RPC12/RpoP